MARQSHSKITIVTDSAANIPPAMAAAHDIHVIPLELLWDGEALRDGVDITPTEFYGRFDTSATHPTTSAPTLGHFLELYTRLADEAQAIVSIHVAGTLSSCVDVARAAAPQVGSLPIRVLDVHTAAMAQGFVVLAAARAAHDGADLEQIVSTVNSYDGRVGLVLTLTTLEHLGRGGRIGDAASLLASRLKIQPILNVDGGRVGVTSIIRGSHRARTRILDEVARRVGSNAVRTCVFHAELEQDAEQLAQQVQGRLNCLECFITEFTPVMGAHTGPRVIGIAYCVEDVDSRPAAGG